MASLFIANGRPNQNWRFFYRVPELDHGSRPPYLDIPMGAQRELRGDATNGGLSEPALSAIIASNRRYGWVEAGSRLPQGRFVPALFSHKIISERQILELREHNLGVMRAMSRDRLDASALAVAETIEEGLNRQQMPDRLISLEAQIMEDGSGTEVDDAVKVTRTPESRAARDHQFRNRRRKISE